MRALPLLLLVLAGCDAREAPADPVADDPAAATIPCAVGGATAFTPICRVSATKRDGAVLLTLYAPDGGFRRVEVTTGGEDIVAADGAERVRLGNAPAGFMQIDVAGDRYRLSARPVPAP